MQIAAAAAALLLLSIVLLPIVARRIRLVRRERAVHLDGGCHWYANYDEDLHYEPHSRSDIFRLQREDVVRRGYQPTGDVQIIPRTFRRRVPGDVKIRLWKTSSSDAKALWLCEWATSPVRVAVGVGGRESVPGVESGCVPIEAENPPETPRTIEASGWAEASADAVAPLEELAALNSEPAVTDGVAREALSLNDPSAEGMALESEDSDEMPGDEALGATSNVPRTRSSVGRKVGRLRRRRRRR